MIFKLFVVLKMISTLFTLHANVSEFIISQKSGFSMPPKSTSELPFIEKTSVFFVRPKVFLCHSHTRNGQTHQIFKNHFFSVLF